MNLKPPFVASIFGSPSSGKSHLIKYFTASLYKRKLIDYVVVMTGTPFTDFYTDFVDSQYVLTYSDANLGKILAKAQQLVPQKKTWLLILDDLLGSANWNKPIMSKLFSCHRHFGISILLTSQYVAKIPPLIRECSWYAFIFAATTHRSLSALYESFGSGFETLHKFKDFLDTLPKYAFVCVDVKEGEASKRYRKLKAPAAIPDFYITN
jgi:hypothetical protein